MNFTHYITSSLPALAGLIAFGYLIICIAITFALWKDAKFRDDNMKLFLGYPIIWALASLIFGPLVVAFYWLVHYSTFVNRKD